MNTLMAAGLGDAIRNVAQSWLFQQQHTAQQYAHAIERVVSAFDQKIQRCHSEVAGDQFLVVFNLLPEDSLEFTHFLNESTCGFFAHAEIVPNYGVGAVMWKTKVSRTPASVMLSPKHYGAIAYR